jgi:pyruvate-ferredoxin/flavodoxin oxidoreductase
MACRQTGWAMLASNSVQEAMDFALIAQAATLESRVPFLHFFDGFRTSHEWPRSRSSPTTTCAHDRRRARRAHRARGLTPSTRSMRGTAQNPDVFFQGREAVNKFYAAVPGHRPEAMDKFAKLTGRQYNLFDYVGAPDAERVIVVMGSGAETAHETVEPPGQEGREGRRAQGPPVPPFSGQAFHKGPAPPSRPSPCSTAPRSPAPRRAALPGRGHRLGEAMAYGRPLQGLPAVIGGRYGLGSKEFTPAMVKAVFDNLEGQAQEPLHRRHQRRRDPH